MKYYIVSDIHGHYRGLYEFLDSRKNLKYVQEGKEKVIFLGDYIDEGVNSFRVLNMLYNIQFVCGNENIVVLRGNHEDDFLEFIFGENDTWLIYDREFKTVKSFLTKEQFTELLNIDVKNTKKLNSFAREKILENHRELVDWLRKLPYFYETDRQIFVHAGIDEEAEELWKFGTPDYYYVSKFPASVGSFYKDIIAGHVSSATVAMDNSYLGSVYFDGKSHYYIDGSIHLSKLLPVLVYDTETEQYTNHQLCVREDEFVFYQKLNIGTGN